MLTLTLFALAFLAAAAPAVPIDLGAAHTCGAAAQVGTAGMTAVQLMMMLIYGLVSVYQRYHAAPAPAPPSPFPSPLPLPPVAPLPVPVTPAGPDVAHPLRDQLLALLQQQLGPNHPALMQVLQQLLQLPLGDLLRHYPQLGTAAGK